MLPNQDDAVKRGTLIHESLELFMQGKPAPAGLTGDDRKLITEWMKWSQTQPFA